jgi:hypothetical protein
VHVRVQFFGEMRRYLPREREDLILELRPGARVIDAVRLAGVPLDDERIVGLNGVLAQDSTGLQDGDELSLYHPMGGGRA